MSKARPIASLTQQFKYENAVIYCRVSSERQRVEGHGLDSQEHRCREFARQKGYKIEKVFKDSFTGGGDYMRRPALSEMLNYIADNAHTNYVVIFDDLKRLARDTISHWQLREHIGKLGAIVESPNFEFKEDDDSSWMHEAINAVFNENERRTNRRQVIQKMKARLESGYWSFGSKRGYTMEKSPIHGKVLTPKEPDASILKEALEGFATGRFQTKVDVCRFLVDRKFWKKQKPERYIDKVTYIMEEPLYAGYIEYLEWKVTRRKGHHEGIISLDTFEAIQKRLKQGNKGKRVRVDVSEQFPLRGLLVCEFSGKPLTGAISGGRKNKYPYYFCQSKDCPCGRKSVPASDIHQEFDEVLQKQRAKGSTLKLVNEIFDRVWEEEVGDYEKENQENQKRLKVLEEQLNQFAISAVSSDSEKVKAVYEKKVEECVTEIEVLSAEVGKVVDFSIPYRTALGKAKGLVKSPYKVWHSVGVKEKQRLFNFIFLEKIPYSKKAGYRTDNLPSAVRLFEDFVTSNSQDVEMSEIESESELGITDESTVRSLSFGLKSLSIE